MNRYETVFIMTPVLSEEQAAETVEKFANFLKMKGAKMKHRDNWGLRRLAYPIQKKTTGFYQLFEFESEGDVIGPFETEFRRDERILRFLTTNMDKFHVQYAESRRAKGKEKKEKPSEAKAEA